MRRIAKGARNTRRTLQPTTKRGLLDVARTEVALAVLYLTKAEARDQICRAIQYRSEFPNNGEAETTQNVDKASSLVSRVFRLFKFVNDSRALISPTALGTHLPICCGGGIKIEPLPTTA
ncbi:peroxisomal membrane protein 11D-like protein [Tanacetum coccineum]